MAQWGVKCKNDCEITSQRGCTITENKYELNPGALRSFSVKKKKHTIDPLSILLTLQPSASFRSDQIRSVAQSFPTLCDPMNRSTPGLPVHH